MTPSARENSFDRRNRRINSAKTMIALTVTVPIFAAGIWSALSRSVPEASNVSNVSKRGVVVTLPPLKPFSPNTVK